MYRDGTHGDRECDSTAVHSLEAMQEMSVYGVSFDLGSKQPIVLLKAVDGETFLPIWIGHSEAAAILMKLQGSDPPRPLTHDLACSLVGALGGDDRQGDGDRVARQHVPRADHPRPG